MRDPLEKRFMWVRRKNCLTHNMVFLAAIWLTTTWLFCTLRLKGKTTKKESGGAYVPIQFSQVPAQALSILLWLAFGLRRVWSSLSHRWNRFRLFCLWWNVWMGTCCLQQSTLVSRLVFVVWPSEQASSSFTNHFATSQLNFVLIATLITGATI